MNVSASPQATPDPQATRHAILAQVLRGIERNRTPGFHFAGNLLALSFDELDEQHASVSMHDGPHCVDADGQVNMAAVSILADIALAAAVRGALKRGMRLATVNLQLQFTGARREGPLHARADFNGYIQNAASQQGISRLTLRNAREEICLGNAAFMVLEPPPGFKLPPMLPLPELAPDAPLLSPDALNAAEARLYAQADAAISAAREQQSSFIERFWHFQTRKNQDGASASLKNGAHVGNRVGHVQGGILLGLAEAAARAALPAHWHLSALTACYLTPGEGTTLTARAKIVHQGKRTAVIHGVITGANRRRILETVATYAAPERKH
jgi:acyl-coenzyme A thioesterase PaaI-like protein